jgi:hypothetical protein
MDKMLILLYTITNHDILDFRNKTYVIVNYIIYWK